VRKIKNATWFIEVEVIEDWRGERWNKKLGMDF